MLHITKIFRYNIRSSNFKAPSYIGMGIGIKIGMPTGTAIPTSTSTPTSAGMPIRTGTHLEGLVYPQRQARPRGQVHLEDRHAQQEQIYPQGQNMPRMIFWF
jgi:hypothetical protein